MYVILLAPQRGDKIDLQPFSARRTVLASAIRIHHPHVNVVAARSQLVINDVLHDVILLRLAEVQPCVAQPNVLKIILGKGIDVPLAFEVEPLCFFDHEGVTHVIHIFFQRLVADGLALHAFECF